LYLASKNLTIASVHLKVSCSLWNTAKAVNTAVGNCMRDVDEETKVYNITDSSGTVPEMTLKYSCHT
jgi:hypothetical protein